MWSTQHSNAEGKLATSCIMSGIKVHHWTFNEKTKKEIPNRLSSWALGATMTQPLTSSVTGAGAIVLEEKNRKKKDLASILWTVCKPFIGLGPGIAEFRPIRCYLRQNILGHWSLWMCQFKACARPAFSLLTTCSCWMLLNLAALSLFSKSFYNSCFSGNVCIECLSVIIVVKSFKSLIGSNW